MNYKKFSFATLAHSFTLFFLSLISIVFDKYTPTELLVAGFIGFLVAIYLMLLQIEQNTSEKDDQNVS